MKLLLRILRWALIVLVLALLLVGGGGYVWLRGALPQTTGSLKVPGLSAPVEIIRDTDAVPHIRAANEADALFGLGYAHAQDRLWQMEFQRRVGNGRISEFAGPSQLDTDKFLRTLGTARAAASAWDTLPAASRAPIEAYVAGVNAFIASHSGRQLPVEFTILGITPEPWRPQDVLVWGKMMAWDLGGNWGGELLRSSLTDKLGAAKANELMPAYIDGRPIILPEGNSTSGATNHEPRSAQRAPAPAGSYSSAASRLLAINQVLKDDFGLGGTAIGSNNWVIGGARTTTGKPLLANDPHLGARIPSIWYLAHITGGAIDAIGATLPGVPGIVIGHNQRIAWGVTNTGPDVQDLFAEHINQQNQVEFKGAWEPLQIIPEVIKVKGQPDVTLNVRVTRHGPLISDVLQGVNEPLAFRWTALDPEDHTIAAFLGINRAQSWADFTATLRDYSAPMQNFVFADVDGNIGYYAPGRLPIRAAGDGTRPTEGWTGANEWTGYVPFDELPHAFNPPQGYIATANNQAVPNSYPHLVSTDWAAPYRAERIVELIESKPKLSPDDIAAMQADQQSTLARRLLPLMLAAKTEDARAKAAIEMLKGWDATMKGDSAQAAVYQAWYAQIAPHLLKDDLGDQLWNQYADERNYIAMLLDTTLPNNASPWCDDTRTPAVEDCATELGAALVDGLADMSKAQGSDDIKSWRWDRVHHAMFPHNVLDGVGALRPIFSRSVPNGGDGFTVDVAPPSTSDMYNQYHVPSYREIIDLSNLDSSRFMHTVGQSGQVLSGDYANLIERWVRVEYMPMRYAKASVDGATAARLVLTP
ncbi:MAG TPA: penicillin acylase family protein [Kouleothrix sp.]|uniref:penicillin acylase family protein n=1 Tax=Kouleothrix sp. TaxID=2779161 RepID=UPI002BF1336E|nr:penicillin acylase family protein [Kouleothrix sp.]HRC76401.1 penicillin acylase family protein [Kouleothrix sp.]